MLFQTLRTRGNWRYSCGHPLLTTSGGSSNVCFGSLSRPMVRSWTLQPRAWKLGNEWNWLKLLSPLILHFTDEFSHEAPLTVWRWMPKHVSFSWEMACLYCLLYDGNVFCRRTTELWHLRWDTRHSRLADQSCHTKGQCLICLQIFACKDTWVKVTWRQ